MSVSSTSIPWLDQGTSRVPLGCIVALGLATIQMPTARGAAEAVAATPHPVSIEMMPLPAEVYVGQQIELRMIVWVEVPRYGRQELDADYVLTQMDRAQLGVFDPHPEHVVTGPRPGFAPQRRFHAFTFRACVVPEQTGPLTPPAPHVALKYPTNESHVDIQLSPTMPTVDVLPIPANNQPRHFAGAVGLFDINVAAAPQRVRVGDPIEVTIDVYGAGSLGHLPPPDVTNHNEWTRDFHLPETLPSGTVVDARRRFTLIVRARDENVTRIPSLTYPYFDPSHERFVVARSTPINLTVLPAATVSTAPYAPSRATSLAWAQRLIERVRPHVPAIAGGLLALIGLTILLFQRRGQAAPAPSPSPLSTVSSSAHDLHNLPTSDPRDTAHAILSALAERAASHCKVPASRCYGPAACTALRQAGVDEDVVARWEDVVEACELVAYAGARADLAELAERARACAGKLRPA